MFFYLWSFFDIFVIRANFWATFSTEKVVLSNLLKHGFGPHFWRFFYKSIWSPCGRAQISHFRLLSLFIAMPLAPKSIKSAAPKIWPSGASFAEGMVTYLTHLLHEMTVDRHACDARAPGLPDFSVQAYLNGKIYQMTTNCTKRP
jgi:hypothetical protein